MDIMKYIRMFLSFLLGKTYKEPPKADVEKATKDILENNKKIIEDFDNIDKAIKRASGEHVK